MIFSGSASPPAGLGPVPVPRSVWSECVRCSGFDPCPAFSSTLWTKGQRVLGGNGPSRVSQHLRRRCSAPMSFGLLLTQSLFKGSRTGCRRKERTCGPRLASKQGPGASGRCPGWQVRAPELFRGGGWAEFLQGRGLLSGCDAGTVPGPDRGGRRRCLDLSPSCVSCVSCVSPGVLGPRGRAGRCCRGPRQTRAAAPSRACSGGASYSRGFPWPSPNTARLG